MTGTGRPQPGREPTVAEIDAMVARAREHDFLLSGELVGGHWHDPRADALFENRHLCWDLFGKVN